MAFYDFINDIGNYEDKKPSRVDDIPGEKIGVSTAYTSDEGYETSLLDSKGVHPVERYAELKDAEIRHEKQVKFAKNADGKSVLELGWSDFGMDKEILLKA